MPDEHTLTLRQIDQARGDLYVIQDEIECMKAQLARLPTRAYFNRTLLMATCPAPRHLAPGLRETSLPRGH
jgi:hypothetical protein